VTDSCAKLWDAFLASGTPSADAAKGATYLSWQFGWGSEMADRLLEDVLSGRKRATTGSLLAYELEGEPVPRVGDYSVVIDGSGVARCVLVTTEIRIIPFEDVDETHARAEGAGDLSLEYWREVHWAFFERELESFGRVAERDMPVVCERFEVLFSADGAGVST
jgi:uncharacterized protein YhfF